MGSKLYYVSTRGSVQYKNKKSFSDVTIEGLASDGGLYLPHYIPQFTNNEINDLSKLSYMHLCSRIISKFTDKFFSENDIYEMANDAYKNFNSPDIAPLFKINDDKYILELFHGPTLAFKDFALQLLSRVFNSILERNNQFLTIVGATSGDTGSAAIEAFKNNKKVNVFILHPEGKISDFQRRQMTTVNSSNVFNIAVKGNFDDCQALVKNMLIDADFKTKLNLASINSINWCRVLAQVIYYFYSAFKVLNNNSLVNFSVPTGNFGDAYAGYIAKKMGLPINKIIVSTNSNDILARFFNTGEYKVSNVVSTLSPSMDIQVASNFERLLFEILDGDTALVDNYMIELKTKGSFKVNKNQLQNLNKTFVGISVNDDMTLQEMRNFYDKFNIILDPHSAVGLKAANTIENKLQGPIIVLSTAHAAKFSMAVKKAIGDNADFKSIYEKIFDYEEKYKILDNNYDLVKKYISKASMNKF